MIITTARLVEQVVNEHLAMERQSCEVSDVDVKTTDYIVSEAEPSNVVVSIEAQVQLDNGSWHSVTVNIRGEVGAITLTPED
jgi:hypothetical protein